MHTSVRLETPCEFINVTPLNPLISKCQIKVCYVSDEPNRNKSVITKEVARQMANSLPGSPIVGYYNENKEDFEEHNRIIDISNGEFKIKDNTRPYGFVDLGAKVWFQKFLDDGETEREYMMTEGYIWTGQYPESQRIIDEGNNQSMELDENTIDAFWTKDGNGKPQFFIINEAIISKLCVLGTDCEPCFEGASITAPEITFSLDESFKTKLFSLMNEMKEILNKGGTPVFTTYAVEIGDSLWTSLYRHLENTYPRMNEEGYVYDSIYRIEGIYEEGTQKFAILQCLSNAKYFRLNFSLSEGNNFEASPELVEVTKTYVPLPTPQFSLSDVEAFELEYAKKKKGEDDDKSNKDDNKEEEKCEECGKAKDECTCKKDKDDKKKKTNHSLDDENCTCNQGTSVKYNLDEIQEYTELVEKYSILESEKNALDEKVANLEQEVLNLTKFKNSVEKKEKEAMIDSFYMLSDEDKKEVIENIDNYSLDDIEAKLSIICVRNKVNFNIEDENTNQASEPITYSLNGTLGDESVPAWVKALRDTAKTTCCQ